MILSGKRPMEIKKNFLQLILMIQGNGDYGSASKLIEEKGEIFETLWKDLSRIQDAGIPRDIIFEQGPEVLGL